MLVREIMTSPVVTAPASATVEEVATLMLERKIGSVVIVDPSDHERAVGIVTETDFMLREERVPYAYPLLRVPKLFDEWIQSSAAFENAYEAWRSRPVSELMSAPLRTVVEDTDVWEAASLMVKHRVNRLPVLSDGRLVGMLARHDVLRCVARTPEAE